MFGSTVIASSLRTKTGVTDADKRTVLAPNCEGSKFEKKKITQVTVKQAPLPLPLMIGKTIQ
jgi:hypothetical protein